MTAAHPRDVTVALASLVQRGLLESGGSHKRTFYFLPGERHRAEVTPLGFELPFTGTRRPAVGHDRTEAEAATVQVTAQVTVQVTIQVAAILNAAREPASRGQLQEAAGLSNRAHFLHRYLQPLLAQGWLEMTIPDKPRSSKQRYRTTQAGLKALEDFVK